MVKTPSGTPYCRRRASHSAGERRGTGSTPFIMGVMSFGSMPASVRLSMAAWETAMIWSA